MAIRGKWNNPAKKNDKNQISSYVSSRPKWPPSTEMWGPWNKYPGRRSCVRYQVTWYNFEQSDWFGINYHIGILVYSDRLPGSSPLTSLYYIILYYIILYYIILYYIILYYIILLLCFTWVHGRVAMLGGMNSCHSLFFMNRHAINHTSQCCEVCTSTCACDRTPFPGRPK